MDGVCAPDAGEGGGGEGEGECSELSSRMKNIEILGVVIFKRLFFGYQREKKKCPLDSAAPMFL